MSESIPEWANDIFVARGVGFERRDVKVFIWHFFLEEHYNPDLPHIENQKHFSQMVERLIKDGYVDMARRHMESLERQPAPKPIRRSAISEFQAKAERLLARFDD